METVLTSTVITVPASFEILQAEATKRAGNIAGFKYVVLLQEPIAAAIAYGFENIKNENWIIYDLGGGTFDVAIISAKDGMLSVLAHNGDNYLGGKDFDWSIVDKIIVPHILQKYSFDEDDDIDLEIDEILKEIEEVVTGIIDELNNNEEYYLQIQSEDTLFNSSKIKVNNGKFSAYITVEKNKSNLFWIYLFDKSLNNLKIWPDSFTITNELSVSGAPIPHSIYIALLKKDNRNNSG